MTRNLHTESEPVIRNVRTIRINLITAYFRGEVLLTQRVTKPWLLLETIFKYTPFAKSEERQKLSLHHYTKKVSMQENHLTSMILMK